MGLEWKVCNTRNDYVDHIWFHITIKNNERIEQGYCLYVCDNLSDLIYHYIEANKVLLNKNKLLFIV